MSTSGAAPSRWLISIIRMPAEPSRHRVAVWRELRRAGAVSLGPSVWALPATAGFADALERITVMAAEGSGTVISLDSAPLNPADQQALLAAFNTARASEWDEFQRECTKFLKEIAHEHEIGKYTLAELDEEEQSLDRLRRWARELRVRDVFAVEEAGDAEYQLSRCIETLNDYADHVYRTAHSSISEPDAPTSRG